MHKRLKKYRKSNGFSKKEMAKKLKISHEKYKQIESSDDAEIDEELKKRIKSLLKKKATSLPKKSKGFLSHQKLSPGLISLMKMSDQINRLTAPFQNPMLDYQKSINAPMNSIVDIARSFNEPKHYLPPNTIADLVKDISLPKESLSWVDIVSKPISDINSISSIFNNQFSAQENFYKSIAPNFFDVTNSHQEIWKNITDTKNTVSFITNTVLANQKTYENYLDFNSGLAKSLLGAGALENYFTIENYINEKQNLTPLDVFSGASFSTIIEDKDDFSEELDLLKRIDEDPKLKQEAEIHFEKLSEILSDENIEDVEEEAEKLFQKFVQWIKDSFSETLSDPFKTARNIFFTLHFLYTVFMPIYILKQSKSARGFQNELTVTNAELIEKNNDLQEAIIDQNETIVEQNETIIGLIKEDDVLWKQATVDVNLRKKPNAKSLKLGMVMMMQNVKVEKENRVWMEITYEDFKTKKKMSGWVKRKFFENLEKN